jgi:hypothetical protein
MSSLVILGNAELQDLLTFLKSPKPFLPACLASIPAKLEVALKFIPRSPAPPSAPSQTSSLDMGMETSLHGMEINSHPRPLVSNNRFWFRSSYLVYTDLKFQPRKTSSSKTQKICKRGGKKGPSHRLVLKKHLAAATNLKGSGRRAMRIRLSRLGPEGLGEKNDVDDDMVDDDMLDDDMGLGGVQGKGKGRVSRRPGFDVIGDGTAIPEEQRLGDIGQSVLSAICSVAEQVLPGANITIVSDVYTILDSLTNRTNFSAASLRTDTLDSLAERCMMAENIEGAAHFSFIINTLQFASTAQRFLSSFCICRILSFTYIFYSREIGARHLTKQGLCRTLAEDLRKKGHQIHFRTLERYFQYGISFCMLGGAGTFV